MWLVVLKPKVIEIQKVYNTEVFNIKRYCKNVDVTNLDFIEQCCRKYLDKKWKRRDVSRLFVRFSNYSYSEVRDIVENERKEELYETIINISKHIQVSILNKRLVLAPIKYYEKVDGMSQKVRIIGVQEPLHQIYDYVVVEGMRSMLEAKIGVFQCASLPGKGQSYGKKYIEKWIYEDSITYWVKGDIKQCFPSIPMGKLKDLLARDVKNNTLVWLACELLDMFKMGLSIGSYLSQYLSNYYLSYAYHYANEQLFKIRRTKKNGNVRVRLINHVLFYMDDFLLTGTSKKDLTRAMRLLIKYINNFLGLEVKDDWKICKLSNTEPIDMMGFVFRKDRTTIRTKIFIKTRRKYLKAQKIINKGLYISEKLAHQCISAYGWYKNTCSYKIRDKLNIDEIHKICRQTVSYHNKSKRGNLNAIVV